MKKFVIRISIAVVLAAIVWGGYRLFKQLPQRQEKIATAKVLKGDVIIRAYTRGELRAVRSVTLTAPNLFSTVQVTRLAPVGALAKEGDLIVEFDDSERRAQLEESTLEVEQIDEQIKKAQADLAIRDSQDQVDLLRTRYAVRRAELEVKRNDIISAIDAKKNLLTLEEQRRRLKQLESDIKSRKEQAQAELAVLREQRNKSLIDVKREEQRIAQAKVLSPMTGLVAIRQNRTGFFMFGQQLPDIREGDIVQPGMPIADVLDLSELEVVAKVGELDRANLHEGQEVLIRLDAVPDKVFHGRIKGMSGTASSNVFSGDPAKKFDVVFSIDMKELLTGLGVKPDQVRQIMETAQRNAKKAPPAPLGMPGGPMMAMGGGPGGAGGPGAAQARAGAEGGAAAAGVGPPQMFAAPGGPGAPAGPPGMQPGGFGTDAAAGMRAGAGAMMRGGFGGAGVSEADRARFRELMQKELGGKSPQELSPEERQKVFAKIREAMGRSGQGDRKGGDGRGGPGGALPATAAPGPGAAGFPNLAAFAVNDRFTEADRAKAKLPPPPEEDSGLQVLLRPGLLADVEIIVEKVPDALHVPAQAVFEKEGKAVVYVQKGKRFEERPVQLVKRSESVMVLAGGVNPGEVIALTNPNVQSTGSKKGDKKGGGAKSIAPMPVGGGR